MLFQLLYKVFLVSCWHTYFESLYTSSSHALLLNILNLNLSFELFVNADGQIHECLQCHTVDDR